jgi:hypothetical protein
MQRPISVTVFGILNIVFAAFGVVGVLGSLAVFSATGATNNPALRIMRESPVYASWLKVAIPLGLLGCLVLLAAVSAWPTLFCS